MWSAYIPKNPHQVKNDIFYQIWPPGGAPFFYYREIEVAIQAMFEHESKFFFCGLKGGLKLFNIKQRNFGSGPFLMLHGRQKVFCTYVEHGPQAGPHSDFPQNFKIFSPRPKFQAKNAILSGLIVKLLKTGSTNFGHFLT